MRRRWRAIQIALVGSALASACFRPRTEAEDIPGDAATPPSDLFASDGGEDRPECPTADPSPLSSLAISVRTSSAGGRFAPKNVGAIWIEDEAGFVKTVARWGQTRAKWLERFEAASDGNLVDAITGPTLIAHETHDVVWDLTDLTGCEVPAGDYSVVLEMTDRSGDGPSTEISFTKGEAPLSLEPADVTSFHDLSLVLE